MTTRDSRPALSINHTIPSIADLSAGPTYSVVRLCETLIGLGQDVSLSVLDVRDHRQVPGFVKRFPVDLGGAKLGNSSHLFASLRADAIEGRTTVLHSHNLWMMPTVYPAWVARLTNRPLVCSPRGALAHAAFQSGSRFKIPFWKVIQRPALDWVSCFHATAKSEEHDIRRHGFHQPVALIPNGIDVPEPVRLEGPTRTLLYLGRLHPNKQVDMLIRAWARVESSRADWRLRIVGADKDAPGFLERLRILAGSLGIRRISFDGELLGDDKIAAFRSADAYVLPTKTENFGITIAEALAAGTPVITTKGAPWPELERRDAGWWIDLDESSLTEAIQSVTAIGRNRLQQMGARGRDWMLRDYSWLKVGDMMLSLYRWIDAGMPGGDRPGWVCPRATDPGD
jgi:glycosyltransferase involved in cell wall biosynthesis